MLESHSRFQRKFPEYKLKNSRQLINGSKSGKQFLLSICTSLQFVNQFILMDTDLILLAFISEIEIIALYKKYQTKF